MSERKVRNPEVEISYGDIPLSAGCSLTIPAWQDDQRRPSAASAVNQASSSLARERSVPVAESLLFPEFVSISINSSTCIVEHLKDYTPTITKVESSGRD